MNWIDIAWPAMGGASLTLGLIHLLLWLTQRNQPALLMYGLAAISVAGLSVFELLAMRAQTPHQYLALLRWAHVPVTLMFIALVGFVQFHFRSGRPWLGVTACILRVVALLPGFLAGESLHFRQIAELTRVELWGGAMVAAPLGNASPAMFVVELADALLVLFFIDAIVSVWKRTREPSKWRSVALVCGSMAVFTVLASAFATLVTLGWLRAPLAVSVPFLAVLIAMSYELGGSVVRTTKLERLLEETETNLRGSEQQFQFTVDAVGLGIWTWDIDSRESWGTETGSTLLGLGKEVRGEPDAFLARIHPDDREAIMRARDDAIRRAGKFECEYRLPQADGGIRWISATGRVEYGGAGKPERIRGVILDITERRQAEERFRLVVDSSPAAMLMVDGEGVIAMANAQAERVFGYNCAELLGHSIDMLVPTHARAGHARYRADFLEHPKARSMGIGRELFGRRKDGSEVPVEIALNPIRITDSLFVLATITDISERLRIERELALQRDELAHLSRITLLGEMSGSIAHELNQPLSAILSNAQAALRFLDRETPDLGEVRESLVHIVENDKRAGEVIRRLRAMLRKEKTDYQELQLNEVVQDVLRLINNDLLNRRVSTTFDLAPDLPAVSGDPVQLQQVLLNLVINACDAMDAMDAARVLTIRTHRASDSFAAVSISDVGRGIPEGDLERIFEPFVTSKPEGMGLGLAVCRTIIHAHHGTLRATNNPSCGATLNVLLPSAGRADTGAG